MHKIIQRSNLLWYCQIRGTEEALFKLLCCASSVSNYMLFDFFDINFDQSFYSKIYAKYYFFCCGLLYQYMFFKNDLNLTMFTQTNGQIWCQKKLNDL